MKNRAIFVITLCAVFMMTLQIMQHGFWLGILSTALIPVIAVPLTVLVIRWIDAEK